MICLFLVGVTLAELRGYPRVKTHEAVREGRAYFIDFGLSKRFPPVPGFDNGTTAVPFQKNVAL